METRFRPKKSGCCPFHPVIATEQRFSNCGPQKSSITGEPDIVGDTSPLAAPQIRTLGAAVSMLISLLGNSDAQV